MARRKPENDGLPPRWRYKHGAYYYRVPAGMRHLWDGKADFRLGRTLAESHRVFADRIGQYEGKVQTMRQLLTRLLIEYVPTLAPSTQRSYRDSVNNLMAVFGDSRTAAVQTIHCYQYRDARARDGGPSAAKHDLQVLSLAFSKAIEWGARTDHPMIGTGFRKPSTPPRRRYVEDWEIVECLALPARRKSGSVRMVQAYIRLKLLTGLRMTDMLLLREADCRDDGIHVQPRKTAKTTGARRIIEWSDQLQEAMTMALEARPLDIAPWVFCSRRGDPYVKEDGRANGFQSIWGRYMDRVLSETKVSESFAERDLRAKCASDAVSLDHAKELLAHADGRLTERVYRRRPQKVRPLR